MNASELLTRLKMDLGIYALSLPFEDPDKAIMEVIQNVTLKTFSSFHPQRVQLTFDLNKNELEPVEQAYNQSCFLIPDDLFGDREIYMIMDVKPRSKLLGNGFMSPYFDGSVDTYNTLMMTAANANLTSIAAPPITFKYEAPNKLYIYNLATYYGVIDVIFGVEHTKNLMSIPPTAVESFYELALIDVKRMLYGAMKHYNEIQSAYGTVSLRIDDWQNAESERKDLIERWRDVYHLDFEQFYII